MIIRLFCAAGMSTSLLVNKMKEAAVQKGKDWLFNEYDAADSMQRRAHDAGCWQQE